MEERSLNEKNDSESETTDTPKKRKRQTRKTKFPLPDGRTSIEKQIKVMQTLNVVSDKGNKAVAYSDIASYAGLNETVVSVLLTSFYKLGWVNEEKHKYTPTKELIDFCNELEWNEPEAGEYFRKVLLGTWFGEYALILFKLHSEMTKEELISSIGKHAYADKSHRIALTRIVEYLDYGKILEFDETNEKFKLTEVDISQEKTEKIKHRGEEEKEISKERITTPFEQEIAATKEIKPPNDLRININVSIDENSDVEAIAKKIIDLKRELHSSNKDETQNS